MVENVKQLYNDVTDHYHKILFELLEVTEAIKQAKFSNEELCDLGFFFKELEAMFDELRKEVKARKELCGKLIAFNKTKELVSDPSLSLTVHGKYATGTPDVKLQAALPKKYSDDYRKICNFLGVPETIVEKGVLKLDWNSVMELCTELAAKGLPVPEGLGKQYPLYVTTFRKRKDHENAE